jgi:hypothetical protein
MVYGFPKRHNLPSTQQGAAKLAHLIDQVLLQGVAAISDFSNLAREKALTGKTTKKDKLFSPTRGTTKERLFIASSLGRSVRMPEHDPKGDRLQRAEAKAADRWMTPAEHVDPDVLESITTYIKEELGPAIKRERQADDTRVPEQSYSACLTTSDTPPERVTRREGGGVAELKAKYARLWLTHPTDRALKSHNATMKWMRQDSTQKLLERVYKCAETSSHGWALRPKTLRLLNLENDDPTGKLELLLDQLCRNKMDFSEVSKLLHQFLMTVRNSGEELLAYMKRHAPTVWGSGNYKQIGNDRMLLRSVSNTRFAIMYLLDGIVWKGCHTLPDPLNEMDDTEFVNVRWHALRDSYNDLRDPSPSISIPREQARAEELRWTPVQPGSSPEMKNKIRVFSLHPADEVQVARGLTGRWLRRLKRVGIVRDSLKGDIIQLRTVLGATEEDEPLLKSTDLAAATDWLQHNVAQHTWQVMNEVVEDPSADLQAGHHILGPHRLHLPGHAAHGQITRRGVHMGLGLGWPVLCILNGWAAWRAQCKRHSTAVCGDDAVILEVPRKLVEAGAWLEAARLRINHSKEFVGEAGVFCEDLIKISDRTVGEDGQAIFTAGSVQLLRIAEATGAKNLAGFTQDRAGTAEGLRRELARETSTKKCSNSLCLTWRQRTPLLEIARINLDKLEEQLAKGPKVLGGVGNRQPSVQELITIAWKGPIRTLTRDRTTTDVVRELLENRTEQPTPLACTFEDALLGWKIREACLARNHLSFDKIGANRQPIPEPIKHHSPDTIQRNQALRKKQGLRFAAEAQETARKFGTTLCKAHILRHAVNSSTSWCNDHLSQTTKKKINWIIKTSTNPKKADGLEKRRIRQLSRLIQTEKVRYINAELQAPRRNKGMFLTDFGKCGQKASGEDI